MVTKNDSTLEDDPRVVLCQQFGLTASQEQIDAIIDIVGHAEDDFRNAVATVVRYTKDGVVQNIPLEYWREDSIAEQTLPIVMSFVTADGLSKVAKSILILGSFFEGWQEQARFHEYLDINPKLLQVEMNALQNRRLLIQHGAKIKVAPPVERWFRKHTQSKTSDVIALAKSHAQKFLDTDGIQSALTMLVHGLPDVRLFLEKDVATELLLSIDRVTNDPVLCGELCVLIVGYGLAAGDTSDFEFVESNLKIVLDAITHDHPSVHAMKLCLAEIAYLKHRNFKKALSILDDADRSSQSDRHRIDTDLKRIIYSDAFQIEPIENRKRARRTIRRIEELKLPPIYWVTGARFMSRTEDSVGQNGSKEETDLQSHVQSARRDWLAKAQLSATQVSPLAEALTKIAVIDGLLGFENQSEGLETMCLEVLDELHGTPFTRHAAITEAILATYYIGSDTPRKARPFFERTAKFFARSGDEFLEKLSLLALAFMAVEDGREELALKIAVDIGWPLDVTKDVAIAPKMLVLSLTAVVFALCGDKHRSARWLLDAGAYAEHIESRSLSWTVSSSHAYVTLANRILDDTSNVGIESALADARQIRSASSEKWDDSTRFRFALEKAVDTWLAAHGLHVRGVPRLLLDSHPPTEFSIAGKRQSLRRRRVGRKIVAALVVEHQKMKLTHLTPAELFAAGWPGEIASYESMKARVYNAISRLRKLGFDQIIVHDGEGYAIDQRCEIAVVDFAAQ